jgi:hypothetical protein
MSIHPVREVNRREFKTARLRCQEKFRKFFQKRAATSASLGIMGIDQEIAWPSLSARMILL